MEYTNIDCSEENYLFGKTSELPNAGNGLFTAIKIYKDEIIGLYKGEELSEKEIKIRSAAGNVSFFMALPNGGILDCGATKGFAKYANDAVFDSRLNNSKITINDNDEICLVAIKNIAPLQEIFCSYGKRYWSDKVI